MQVLYFSKNGHGPDVLGRTEFKSKFSLEIEIKLCSTF